MFKGVRNEITARLSLTREHWAGLRADFAARQRNLRRSRDAGLQKALMQDFSQVLEAWGIASEADIPGILRDLHLRCLFFALPIPLVLVSVWLTPGLYSCLTLILIAPPCLFGLLSTRWRISILKNRAFMPLFRWLTARFTQKRST